MIEKPPVAIPSLGLPTDVYAGMVKQRDADVKYYEPLIKEMYEMLKEANQLLTYEFWGIDVRAKIGLKLLMDEVYNDTLKTLAKVENNNAK